MQVLLTISEHRAHTRLPYTQIYSIYDLYINIYIHTHVHICRVHLQAPNPRSRTAVGDPEESRPYFWAALLGAGRKLAIAREGGAGWESRGDSARPAQLSALQSSLPPPKKREHLVCQVSGRTPVIPKLGTQRKDNLCKSEVRWSTLVLHGGEFPASWGQPRETPCQIKQDAQIWLPCLPQGFARLTCPGKGKNGHTESSGDPSGVLASVGVRPMGVRLRGSSRGALECQPHSLISDSSQATRPGAVLTPLSRDQGLSLSCLPPGPPAHPLQLVSVIRWGPRVYPLVTCTVLEDVLLLWLPCLRPLRSLTQPSCNCLSFCSF